MINRATTILLFLLLNTTLLLAQWTHFVNNFLQENNLAITGQTWHIDTQSDSWLYFANSKGMIQYNGESWSIYPMKNQLDARSTFFSKSKKRIYVGGINEFGYYTPNVDGRLNYTCMSDSFEVAMQLNNIWGIYDTEQILYVQGDHRILKINNGKHTLINSRIKFDCSNLINDILYLGTDKGLYMVVGSELFPANGCQSLNKERIRALLPYRDGMVIVTASSGLYYYHGGRHLHRIANEWEKQMVQHEVFCAAIKGETIALGTVHAGIITLDLQSNQVSFYNETNGLQNNTVLSLSFDTMGNLWAGLDRGVDQIRIELPLTNLYRFPNSYGAGYDAAIHNQRLYIGTNRGLYHTEFPQSPSEKPTKYNYVEQSTGQVWRLQKAGNELFCLHDRGLFRIVGNELERIGEVKGVWGICEQLGNPNNYIIGTYSGLHTLQQNRDKWEVSPCIETLTESFYNFEFESPEVLWSHNGSEGVMRVEFEPNSYIVKSKRGFNSLSGFLSSKNISVSKIRGKIYFTTTDGIYRYESDTDRMVLDEMLNGINRAPTRYVQLLEHKNHLLAITENEITRISTYENGKKRVERLPIIKRVIDTKGGFERLIPINDSLYIFPNNFGFALFRYNVKREETNPSTVDETLIRRVHLTSPKDSIIYTDNFRSFKSKPEIAYSSNGLRFDFGTSNHFSYGTVRYRCRVRGKDKWSDLTELNRKEYTNLSAGDYTFEVEAHYSDGSSSKDSYAFLILPPWHQSRGAYIGYFSLLLFLFFRLYRWDKRRLHRKHSIVSSEKDKEILNQQREYEKEYARQEHQIMKLEQDKLRTELGHKSQEMANLLMNFARKNEALLEIKEELTQISAKLKVGGNKESLKMVLLLNNKIESNMQSDELLKRFEEQFDLVHNNFIDCLRSNYADLTQNELLMCAYLKMNLCTKEIAPLLNISVRGVETMRYRIRKKFELNRESSLTEFLNRINLSA